MANAPGNFGRLMSWAGKKHPMPLPLGLVSNSRSLVAIDNLVDFDIAEYLMSREEKQKL